MILPEFISSNVKVTFFVSILALFVVLSIVYMNSLNKIYLDENGDTVCIIILFFSFMTMLSGIISYSKEIQNM